MNALIEYFIHRSVFVNLLTILLIGVGGFIAATANREAFPNVDFDIVTVSTVYPGASPEEVEKLVTNPLEDSIQEVDGIEELRSSSIEGRSGIVITIDPDVDETQKVIDDIRSAVDRTEDLPEEAEDPVLLEISTARNPVIEFTISSANRADGTPLIEYRQIREYALQLERRLQALDGVARIERKGLLDAEIQVNLDPDLLSAFYLSPLQVVRSLRERNISLPGGVLENGETETIVRTEGEFSDVRGVANTPVRSNDIGQQVRVGDVARVTDGFEEPLYLESVRGRRSISLVVVKRESSDIITLVEESRAVVSEFQKTLPNGVETGEVNDISYFVKRRLGILFSNGIAGLLLVVASLFIFMGWRTSLMVALGIPIALGTAFIIMNFLGVTLNLISMFGLIIVIGILVDDAIIVSENFYRYLEQGLPAVQAAIKGTTEVVAPVMATVATSIAAFAPMMFMTGIFGKFIFTIPLVVIIALLSSLFECFFMLPSHLYDVNKFSHHAGEVHEESGWFHAFRLRVYEPALHWGLTHRWLVLPGFVGMLIVAFALQGLFGRFKLFPGAIDALHVRVSAPAGVTKQTTDRFLRAVEESIRKLPPAELDTYAGRAGITQRDPNDPFTKRGSEFGDIKVYLTPEVDRERSADEIILELRFGTEWLLTPEALARKRAQDKIELAELEDKGFEVARYRNYAPQIPAEYADLAGRLEGLEFEKLAGGPPVGKPVAIEISGDDFAVLEKIGEEYKAVLAKIPGVKDIDDDFLPGKDEIRLQVNERAMAQTGVSVISAAQTVNAALAGAVATTIKDADEEIDVRVRFAEERRRSAESILRINVVNAAGNLIPLAQLAQISYGQGVRAINHKDGERLLTVSANIDENQTTSTKTAAQVARLARGIPEKYPGYIVEFGGENKDTEESMASLGRAFLVGVLIIFMILASTFRSVIQPLIVLLAVPFSLIVVILAFLLHGEPFSFLAMLGVIGLSGVVVNDSIVLVDFANTLRAANPDWTPIQVALKAGSMRLRAVILTTLTTVLGLLPTAYGIGGYDPFLVPMALSFAWGLLFATVLTLGLIPIFYVIFENLKAALRGVLVRRGWVMDAE